ncbi:F-box/kelch-repeat protein At3g23880 [Lathyrus oleraceus]|uniref:F-box/kelch-repeat protein At3g23880 n=1 Tax=Pisum sativum TaxID=3888 RepID=UPI0021CE2AE3|nr:F-box/kelch-repeat protein At3g23880-like [Pisum sativum]
MPLPTLPFDVVVEILSRLPVKILMQLQCVCKSWKSLISDPKFAKKHLRHASQSLVLTVGELDFVVIANPLSSVFTEATTTTIQVAVVCYPHTLVQGPVSNCRNLVKVHTLGTTSWRIIQDFPPNTLILNESGKFLRGAINWLAYRQRHSSCWVIMSLDLEKEFHREIPQPDYGGINVLSLNIGVLRDCLCIFSNADTFSDVWLMKEYGNKDSWTKLFRLPHTRNLGSWPLVYALYVSNDDQVLFDIEREELVVYNFRDGTFKDPGIQIIDKWMESEVYHESLISPCF